MTSRDVMIALTRTAGPFCRRRWISVPNVSWGWGLGYEADLIVIGKHGNCYEIEIKVSRADLRADAAKSKWRDRPDRRIQKFYYAVPEKMAEYAAGIIPPAAGLVSVTPGNDATSSFATAKILRRAEARDAASKPTTEEVMKLQHLGVMRYWDLLMKEGKS